MARKPRSQDNEDIVREAQERYDRAHEYQAVAHGHYVADMQFANGDDDNKWQWRDDISAGRQSAGRPALTVNKTRIHCLQIINDARQNPVQIRVNPVGDDATYEAAQIYEGIIRHIEYISNAQQAYANATYCQVMGGIGYWRVLVDYLHDNTFDQEIYIQRIGDPTSVYMDPDIQQADGSDAKWAFLFYELTRDEYKAEYGTSDDPDDANLNNAALTLNSPRASGPGDRTDDQHVQVVEYWRVVTKSDRLLQMHDGSVVRESRLPAGMLDQLSEVGVTPRAERDIAEPRVEWFLIADSKIIDRKEWPGKYIPIVRVPCEEVIIKGKLDWVSHVRHLRDPQRLYNWYTSQAAEFVALQTKSPYIAVAESIEQYLQDWENANVQNKGVLLYKGRDVNGNEIAPPQRLNPPQMAQAYIEGLKVSQAEMMMATGQYQAVMGEPSNEVSGKAINARQRQGDNATYHVIDRLASAIRYTGRIILDLIPAVYDTERVMMIMGEDGSQVQVHVDPNAPVPHQTTLDPNQPPPQPMMSPDQDPDVMRQQALRTIFNPRIGRYAVVSDVGPSYATKRQEAFNALSQIVSQTGAWQVFGDFWAKVADFPDSDKLAVRLKKGLPPQYQSGPDPQVQGIIQQAQKTQQEMQQILQQQNAEIAQLKAQVVHQKGLLDEKAQKLAIDAHGVAIDDYRAETDRLKAVGQIDPKALQIVVRQLLSDMMQTDIIPHLQAHARIESGLQQQMAPPPPPEPAGAAQNGADGGPGNG